MSKRQYIIFTLLLNGIVPWVLYVWISDYMSSFTALSLATMVPLADNLVHLIKHRKLDVFGSLMLFTFVLTLVLVALGGSERILLIRESMITGAVGSIFLGSLLFHRPLMFHLAIRFIGNPDYEGNWQYGYFRYVMRLMTFVWGMIVLIEAAVRNAMVFQLTTAQFLALSNLVLYGLSEWPLLGRLSIGSIRLSD
ncbi:VC0807 family protein [Paenibacillus alginolyticus]|uniref:VC0807 family protein n=1 Tax=Paenibacillus alginolyticus TaxID=59839 RepID=UPI001FEA95A2|nr:VC0807 family protein [Paenibacillus frigoriresistens]